MFYLPIYDYGPSKNPNPSILQWNGHSKIQSTQNFPYFSIHDTTLLSLFPAWENSLKYSPLSSQSYICTLVETFLITDNDLCLLYNVMCLRQVNDMRRTKDLNRCVVSRWFRVNWRIFKMQRNCLMRFRWMELLRDGKVQIEEKQVCIVTGACIESGGRSGPRFMSCVGLHGVRYGAAVYVVLYVIH